MTATIRHQQVASKDAKTDTSGPEAETQTSSSADLGTEEFARDYQQVCREFQTLERDLYRAPEMEALIEGFYGRHQSLLERAVYEFAPEVRPLVKVTSAGEFCDKSRVNELLLDDLSVFTHIKCQRSEDFGKLASDYDHHNNHHNHRLLADILRRRAEASSVHLVHQLWRHKTEADRTEPLRWAQLALRHNPNDFRACYWYMAIVGRYSELAGLSARDRVLAGEAFKRACLRCILMEPRDPLAHHLLGRYYYHVGGLNWLQRQVCKNFFNYEVKGTYEDAEREYRYAHSLYPNWAPVGLWMARLLRAQKRPRDETRYWVELGLSIKCEEPYTELQRDELVALARELGMADAVDAATATTPAQAEPRGNGVGAPQ